MVCPRKRRVRTDWRGETPAANDQYAFLKRELKIHIHAAGSEPLQITQDVTDMVKLSDAPVLHAR